MFKRLTRVERERKRIEDVEFVRQQRQANAQAVARAMSYQPCERHPAWQPRVRSDQIPPPASMCPYCKREASERHVSEYETVEVPHPLNVHATPKFDDRYAEWKERHPSRVGIEPGSAEEEAALERIEELREEERDRDAAKHGRAGRVVIERIENGSLVQYIEPPRRGRRGALGLNRVVV